MNYKDLVERALEPICVINSENTIIYANPAFIELTGYSSDAIMNMDFSLLLPADVASKHKELIQRFILSGNSESSVLGKMRRLQLVLKSGDLIPIELKAFEMTEDPDLGRVFAGVFRDLRESEKNQLEYNRFLYDLNKLGFIDPISQLPNEKFLFTRLEETLSNSRNNRESIYSIINLDEMEQINNKYGREAGDLVVRKIATEFQYGIRLKDYLGRLENGNLACLFPSTSLSDVIHLLDNIRSLISRKKGFIDQDPNMKVTVSIGCSRILFPAKTIDSYVQEAEKALKRAKSEGKNKLLVFGFY